MIVGIGTDITSVKRIAAVFGKYGERFVKRILTSEEIDSYNSRVNKIHYLAKRFAAKEAVAKALGTGIKRGVFWRNITVINQPSGAPFIVLREEALARYHQLGAKSSFVSISDEQEYAIAFVIFSSESSA